MAEEIYGFDAESVRWLRLLVQERRAKQGDAPTRQLPNWQHVRITGDANVSGSGLRIGSDGSGSGDDEIYYPGVVVKWDAARREGIDLGVCWVRDWNRLELQVDEVYPAQQTGNLELDTDGSGSGTAQELRPLFVTTENAAATPTIASILPIEFNHQLIQNEADPCWVYLSYQRRNLYVYDDGTVAIAEESPQLIYGGLVDLCACDCSGHDTASPPIPADCPPLGCDSPSNKDNCMTPLHMEATVAGVGILFDLTTPTGTYQFYNSYAGFIMVIGKIVSGPGIGNDCIVTISWPYQNAADPAACPGVYVCIFSPINCCYSFFPTDVRFTCTTDFNTIQISGGGAGTDVDGSGNWVSGGRKGDATATTDGCSDLSFYFVARSCLPGDPGYTP